MYVGLRQFTNFGTNFPDLVREWMIHTGVCHYLVVIRTPQGRVFSYDFGPPKGEIEVPLLGRMEGDSVPNVGYGADDSLMRVLTQGPKGEIREEEVLGGVVPDGCKFCGVSPLSLEDLRSYVRVQPTAYTLFGTDCRHFANKMVYYGTGVKDAASCTPTSQLLHEHVQRLNRQHGEHMNAFSNIGNMARTVAYQFSLVEHCTAIRVAMATMSAAALSSATFRVAGALAPLVAVASKPMQVVAAAAPKLRSVPAVVAAVSTAVQSGDVGGVVTALGLSGSEAAAMGEIVKAGSSAAAAQESAGAAAAAATASGLAKHVNALGSAARAAADGATAAAVTGTGAMVAAASEVGAGVTAAAAVATTGVMAAATEVSASVSAAAAATAGGMHIALLAAAGAGERVADAAQRLLGGEARIRRASQSKASAGTQQGGAAGRRVTLSRSASWRAGAGGGGLPRSASTGQLATLRMDSAHSLSLSARQLPSISAKATRMPRLAYKELAPLQVTTLSS